MGAPDCSKEQAGPCKTDNNPRCNKGIHCAKGLSFPCDDGDGCVLLKNVCDGIRHCTDGSDEFGPMCAVKTCPMGYAKRPNSTVCFPQQMRCDHVIDVQSQDDEKECVGDDMIKLQRKEKVLSELSSKVEDKDEADQESCGPLPSITVIVNTEEFIHLPEEGSPSIFKSNCSGVRIDQKCNGICKENVNIKVFFKCELKDGKGKWKLNGDGKNPC